MKKKRFSQPDGPVIAAQRIIKMAALIIGIAILGSFAYELLAGTAPDLVQAIAIVTLVAIGMWLKENA